MKTGRIFLVNFLIILMFTVGAYAGSPFWSMYVGNYWEYSGTCDPPCGSWTWRNEVMAIDTTTVPGVTTYRWDGKEVGLSVEEKTWFEISPTYLKGWRLEIYDDTYGWITVKPSTGYTILNNPIVVPSNWTDNMTGDVTLQNVGTYYSINVTSTVNVLSYANVTVPLGTYKAYKLRNVLSVPSLSLSRTQDLWVVPYLGIVRIETPEASWTEIETLTSMKIRKPHFDVNSNAKTDILWHHATSGQTAVWLMDGSTYSMGSPGTVGDLNWQIKAMGDFDGDGKADILWQDTSSGWTSIWFMNGTSVASSAFPGTVNLSWQIKKVADFNGDGKADILWQDSTSGWVAIWFMDGATITSTGAVAQVNDPNWQLKKVGDFNGDGKADILWQNTATGWTYIWFMDGATITSGGAPAQVADSNWQLKKAADFNGDGKADILWRNTATGWTYIWFMDGATITSGGAPAQVGDSNWQIACLGDFNGDGKADVFWQHTTTGWTYIWFMDGATISSDGVPGVVSDMNWEIMN
jgi:hypothetical protein